MKRLGILLSGRGSNFEAIADTVAAGKIAAEIAIVVANRPEARGLEVARLRGLPAVCIPSKGTVHFVDEYLDAGPIIVQAAVPVLDGDTVETLSGRILSEEHRIYSEAIRMVLSGTLRIEGRRVLGGH